MNLQKGYKKVTKMDLTKKVKITYNYWWEDRKC